MKFGTVLVTGGAGFIGSQLVKTLEPISERIFVIDDLSVGERTSLPDSPKIIFYQASITDEKLLESVLPNVEWIFHLACRSLTLSTLNIHQDYYTNLYGGYQLLSKAKDFCPGLKRFLYTSTASIYGNSPVVPTPEQYFHITTPYAASKFSVEHYCMVFQRLFEMPISIVRLSNVYGPGQLSTNPYCGVVAKFFEAILKKKPLPIYGDGTQTRDFTFVQDAINAIIAVMTHPAAIGKVYNIGTGRETSVNQLAELVAKTAGRSSYPVNYIPRRVIDHINYRSVDIKAIGEDLNWFPRYTLDEGLYETYQWYVESQQTKGNEEV